MTDYGDLRRIDLTQILENVQAAAGGIGPHTDLAPLVTPACTVDGQFADTVGVIAEAVIVDHVLITEQRKGKAVVGDLLDGAVAVGQRAAEGDVQKHGGIFHLMGDKQMQREGMAAVADIHGHSKLILAHLTGIP